MSKAKAHKKYKPRGGQANNTLKSKGRRKKIKRKEREKGERRKEKGERGEKRRDRGDKEERETNVT